MPRKFRVHYRGAFYHVILRGNNRKKIFLKKTDYQKFLDVMANAADIYHFKVHLYCLMTNHVHLVIEVDNIPISKIMQSVSSRFARIHNEMYNKVGHLFQGRFKSKLISDDQYLMELCYYIHMNPIKANMCKLLDEYRWSSHHEYKLRNNMDWMVTDYIRKVISNHFDKPMNYMQFMASYRKAQDVPLFCRFDERGHLDIINDIGTRIQNTPSLALENISLAVISKIVCKRLNVSLASIESASQARRVTLARSMIAYFSHYHAKYTFEDISSVLCRKAGSISKALNRHLKLAKTSREVQVALSSIERDLSLSDADRLVD